MSDRSISRREVLRITASVGLGGALGGAFAAEVLREARLHRVRETRNRMGTVVTITAVHPVADEAQHVVTRALDEMARLEGIFSRHQSGTPVSRLNATGRLEAPPGELLTVLRSAKEYADVSRGAFDPTIAPLLGLYQRSFADRGREPRPVEVARARELVDFRAVRAREDLVSFELPDMSITLDGIAKGYIVDRTVDVLAAAGFDRVLVDAGGDMAAAGNSSMADPWTVAIQDPHLGEAYAGVVRLGASGVATSGDYMQSFTPDRRFHHIIDPRTGISPEETSAVTVVAGSAMQADALSTAVLVLGPHDGIRLLDRMEGTEGLIVSKGGHRAQSSGFGDALL